MGYRNREKELNYTEKFKTGDEIMMKCPYCGSEMDEGALVSRVVPLWVKKGEKKGTLLNCKKSFTQNELLAHSCVKCKKIILDI